MRLTIVLIALIAAGCIGGGDATPREESASDVRTAAVDPVPSPAENASDEPEAPPRVVPVAWQGKISRSACIPSGPNSCTGTPVPLGEGDSFEPLDERASVVDLTMTWTADSPLTEELSFYLLKLTSCGEGCLESQTIEGARGPSPLKFEGFQLQLGENETLGLYVTTAESSCVNGVVVLGCARVVEQAFQVDGALLVPSSP